MFKFNRNTVRRLLFIGLIVAAPASAFAWRVQTGQPLSVDTFILLGGAILSVAGSYIPGWNTWFAGLEPVYKRLITVAAMALLVGYAVLEACTGVAIFNLAATCSQTGFQDLARLFVLAVVASQGAYLVVEQPAQVRAIAAAARARAQARAGI